MVSRAKSVLWVVAVVLCGAMVQAQPVAETCGAGDTLGPVTLPWTSSPAFDPASQNFTITCGSPINGQDVVICFKPATACVVDVTCTTSPGAGTLVLDVFSGACATAASCDTGTSQPGPSLVLGVSLSAGTNYCAVCSSSNASASFTIGIAVQSGNCGAMPVSLQSFTAE